MNWKLELVAIPVSDVDRAKSFYVEKVGFRADHDQTVSDEIRFVQLVVDDIEQAREELVQRGVDAGEIQDFPWGRFVFFSDPDGNKWSVQQIPPR